MVCSACRLLFHTQYWMFGYIWVEAAWLSASPSPLQTTFIICLCHWKLHQPIVMPYLSWAAQGRRSSCCDWEHCAIRTMCWAPNNSPYVCFTPFSHHFSCIQFQQCTAVPAAALPCACQGCWLMRILQNKRAILQVKGHFLRKIGGSLWLNSI